MDIDVQKLREAIVKYIYSLQQEVVAEYEKLSDEEKRRFYRFDENE